jgi:hypothetical protein
MLKIENNAGVSREKIHLYQIGQEVSVEQRDHDQSSGRTFSNSNADFNSNTFADSNFNSNSFADSDSDSDSNTYSNTFADFNSNTNTFADFNSNTNYEWLHDGASAS